MADGVVVDASALNKKIQSIESKAKNPRIEMAKVKTVMYQDVMNHFKKEQGEKRPWKSIDYRKGKILQDTGRLRASIRPSSDNTSATVGTNLDYAATHNYGRGSIPQRKFMWLSKEAIDSIKRRIGRFVVSSVV